MTELAQQAARAHARVSLAVVVVLIALSFNLAPSRGSASATGLRFTALALPDPAGAGRPHMIRQVNPSLRRIDAWISAVGAGIALGDFDNDRRDDDLCQVDPRFDSVVVEPVPGTGRRYPATLLTPGRLPYNAATMAPMGCLPVDANLDGRMDLVVYYWGRTPVLFERTAAGRYAARELVPGRGIWNTNAMLAADVDGDGHADLVVGNYFADGDRVLDAHSSQRVSMQSSMSRATNGGTARVLLWTPRGYREAPGAIPAAAQHGWTLAVGAQDLNGDLLPELYFANDFGSDRLLLNRSTPGHVRLQLVTGRRGAVTASSKVLGHDSFKGMGVDFGDLNGDGRPDMFVSNITEQFALMESNFAWVSTSGRGPLSYRDRSESLGLARSGWGWDTRLDDLDDDGRLDAVQATGFVRGDVNRWPELQELAIGNDAMLSNADHWPHFGAGTDISGHDRDALYLQDAHGRFHNVASAVGLDRGGVSRGVASADVNGDGRLDLAIANQWQRSYVFINRCGSDCGSSLELRLLLPVGGGRATPAIGAQATVLLGDGRRLERQVDGGNGHSGKRTSVLHFGLGAQRAPVRVQLRWRDLHGNVRSRSITVAPGIHEVRL